MLMGINARNYKREHMTTADVHTVLKQAADTTPDSAIDNSGKSPEEIEKETQYRNLMRSYFKEISEARNGFDSRRAAIDAKLDGAVPVVLIFGYLLINYDSGTRDPATLNGITITYKDRYQSHVHNNTGITLKSLTLTCIPGGDAQPVTTTTGLYPPLKPGFGEDAYVEAGCKLVRVNETHQLW